MELVNRRGVGLAFCSGILGCMGRIAGSDLYSDSKTSVSRPLSGGPTDGMGRVTLNSGDNLLPDSDAHGTDPTSFGPRPAKPSFRTGETILLGTCASAGRHGPVFSSILI